MQQGRGRRAQHQRRAGSGAQGTASGGRWGAAAVACTQQGAALPTRCGAPASPFNCQQQADGGRGPPAPGEAEIIAHAA